MRTEAVSFRRCCFCIPLRYGLLAWGYFRLLVAGLMLFGLSLGLKQMIERAHSDDTIGFVIISVVIIIVVVDIALGIVFIVGCHKKDPTLIKKYYYHSIFLLSLFVPLGLYHLGSMAYLVIKYVHAIDSFLFVLLDCFILFAYISLQVYIVLLVRSQFMKLTEGCQFRFENNAIEPGCSLNIETSNRVEKEDNSVSNYNKIDIENGDGIRNYS